MRGGGMQNPKSSLQIHTSHNARRHGVRMCQKFHYRYTQATMPTGMESACAKTSRDADVGLGTVYLLARLLRMEQGTI